MRAASDAINVVSDSRGREPTPGNLESFQISQVQPSRSLVLDISGYKINA